MPQSLSNILIHIIFSTKNREPLIELATEPELHKYLAAMFRENDSPALAVGGTYDHIHVLCALSRTHAVADVVEEVKTSSSKWMKRTAKNFYWQSGYGAFSIGNSQKAAVKEYIATQRQHHAKITFQDEYREFLKKYDVEYDERYVWD